MTFRDLEIATEAGLTIGETNKNGNALITKLTLQEAGTAFAALALLYNDRALPDDNYKISGVTQSEAAVLYYYRGPDGEQLTLKHTKEPKNVMVRQLVGQSDEVKQLHESLQKDYAMNGAVRIGKAHRVTRWFCLTSEKTGNMFSIAASVDVSYPEAFGKRLGQLELRYVGDINPQRSNHVDEVIVELKCLHEQVEKALKNEGIRYREGNFEGVELKNMRVG